jgi:predicted RNA binding protein YcfA (HicA-like mRNA interferase family)
MASEMRFPEVKRMLEAKGYFWHRTNGSHHLFKKPGVGTFSVPVHNGKVKPIYVKQIQKL